MQWLENIVLGLIQGLTEFIPVSSSGHLVIAQFFFFGSSNHYFLEFIDLGTTLALLIYFRHRIIKIIHDVFVDRNVKLARNIIITAVPAGLVGYVLADFINSSWFFGSIVVVLIALASVGTLMIVSEKLPRASQVESGAKLPAWRALIIGLVQILALIPGVSRSGSTILAGRLAGLPTEAAAEYSFLASLPIMLGVSLKLFTGAGERAYLAANWQMLTISNLAALVAGLVAVAFMLRYLARHSLVVFGWYRVALAAVLAVILIVWYH